MSTALSQVFDRVKAAWPKPIDLTDEELVEVTSWLLSHSQHSGVWPRRLRIVADYNQRKRDGTLEASLHPPVAAPRSWRWRLPLDPGRLSGSGSAPRAH
jgi:hypothetical protein